MKRIQPGRKNFKVPSGTRLSVMLPTDLPYSPRVGRKLRGYEPLLLNQSDTHD